VSRANTAHKLEILSEWAVLEEEAFGAPDRATTIYRAMLSLVPTHGPALRAREAPPSRRATPPVRPKFSRRTATSATGPSALHARSSSRSSTSSRSSASDALAAATRALEPALPGDKAALAVVEELLAIGDTRARAAVVLEAPTRRRGTSPARPTCSR
jgi:hypothetical protein